MSDHVHLLRSVLAWGGVDDVIGHNLHERAEAALSELEAENQRLRDALIAMREVAAVANEGDPWYCEHEGIDTAKAFALARAALTGEVRTAPPP